MRAECDKDEGLMQLAWEKEKELKRVRLQPLIKRDKICQTLTKRIERTLKL